MAKTVIAFDLYGTLLSTESISQKLAEFYGEEKSQGIATQARRYQLEYTWRSNSMGIYRPFDALTRSSFHQATAEVGIKMSEAEEEEIMRAYNGLDTFPEVESAMQLISSTENLEVWIFSNGTHSMIKSSVETSNGLAASSRDGTLLPNRIISVDDLSVFKPNPRTYEHMVTTANQKDAPEKVWLVSSNPFDALGSRAAGMSSVWVDRGGLGWVDGLGAALDLKPTAIVGGVDEAVREIIRRER